MILDPESESGVLNFLTVELESHKNARTPHPWQLVVIVIRHTHTDASWTKTGLHYKAQNN